eukprot:15163301-Alexandrium_andersonii.AAC.1
MSMTARPSPDQLAHLRAPECPKLPPFFLPSVADVPPAGQRCCRRRPPVLRQVGSHAPSGLLQVPPRAQRQDGSSALLTAHKKTQTTQIQTLARLPPSSRTGQHATSANRPRPLGGAWGVGE